MIEYCLFFKYYVSQATDVNDLKGLAAFLLASIEFEKLPHVGWVMLDAQVSQYKAQATRYISTTI